MNTTLLSSPGATRSKSTHIPFVKMHGIGNDFIVVRMADLERHVPERMIPAVVKRMCDRRFGIGGDGVLLIDRVPETSDVIAFMRPFNADGTEAEVCGNGLRCAALFVMDELKADSTEFAIRTFSQTHVVRVKVKDKNAERHVAVDLGEPVLAPAEIPINTGTRDDTATALIDVPLTGLPTFEMHAVIRTSLGSSPKASFVSMGNPHVVIFHDDVASVPLSKAAPAIAGQPLFPAGVNVHFVQWVSQDEVIVRHWERGSGMTLACGSGACAVCVAGALAGKTNRALTARLPGGTLHLHWNEQTNRVLMVGPAESAYTGVWSVGAFKPDSNEEV